MKPVFQTITDPIFGNCRAACIASLLEVDIDDVPNIHGPGWFRSLNDWLRETHGVALVTVELGNTPIWIPDGVPYIASVTDDGCEHAVIMECRDQKKVMVHDPYPLPGEFSQPKRISFLVKAVS